MVEADTRDVGKNCQHTSDLIVPHYCKQKQAYLFNSLKKKPEI